MVVSEFIDAYSDDQIYIDMLEGLVSQHPVESLVPDSIRYSSLARLWVVMMVGGVECSIKEWTGNNPRLQDIHAYFEKGPNDGRIRRLERAFTSRGIPADPERFQDYLAIKYIRNAYVHAQWDESQRQFVEARGFPGSVMRFSQADYGRMKECYYHVLNRLGAVYMMDSSVPAPARLNSGV